SLLWDPAEVLKQDGTPYKVFTAYYKQAIQIPHNVPANGNRLDLSSLVPCTQGEEKIAALNLMPNINWYDTMARTWQPGETGAMALLESFLDQGLEKYSTGRDFPSIDAVSRLSPHLHHGEIAPGYLLNRVMAAAAVTGNETQGEHYRRELAWREFSHYLLYYLPHMSNANMNSRFDAFPWRSDDTFLKAWQKGETGYPLVDAGMRELWQTGYMHNRVRMVVASFLTKNLMQHWLYGARWFWDCLVDADLANNSCSWQWVAGCGADAAPYFRIFNPVTQSQKFDPAGTYIRQYLPELAGLDDAHIHQPWKSAGSIDYPRPVVDLKESRESALQAYQTIRK
ncbi:MAG: deoxyribodipyrimidine photo-lyase, partial [Gammaproteobacteria bacterium]